MQIMQVSGQCETEIYYMQTLILPAPYMRFMVIIFTLYHPHLFVYVLACHFTHL